MNIKFKRRIAAVVVAVGSIGSAVGSAAVSQAAPQRPAATSTASPNRILDTRENIGNHPGKVVPGEVLKLAVPQAAGATSVLVNLTATQADGPGWIKAWPCGVAEPGTSSLNFTPGSIAANAVAVKLGAGGICITTYAPVHLVVDLAGWFTGTADYVGTTPNRIVDTRVTHDPLTGGTERRIAVAGTPNIPGSAALVAVNLTVDSPLRAGWVVAYPCGQPTSSSTVNFNAGEIVANFTAVAVAGGAICVRSYDTTDLIVDTYGYSTGDGQLQVQSPQRLLDTRDASSWPYGIALSGQKVAVRVAGTGKVPASADSAILTVTVADAAGDGFVTVWPCDQPLPNASTINTVAGQLRSNLAMVKLAADGTACLQVNSLHDTPLSLVVDAVGWTTGGPNRTTLPTNPIAPTGGVTPAPLAIPAGPLGGPGCSLANAAFCETFDAPHNGGTQTGDLDPVLWGVSRVGDANPGQVANGLVASHNGCAGGGVIDVDTVFGASTPPPADVRVCNGQMLESVNDGGGVGQLNTYPKQPFSFGGRTGTVVFDVSGDSGGSHAAWPEFLITDKPVPGVRRSISLQPPAHAQNQIGFSLDGNQLGGCNAGTGVGSIFMSVNGQYSEPDFTTYDNCITKGSRLAMNHIKVTVSQTRIDVYGTDAGGSIFKHLVGANISLAFNQGLVWLDDVHYNARKGVEVPCGGGLCAQGTQYDHTFAWDNLGFDGPKTYRDLGFDVPYANGTGSRSSNGDPELDVGYVVGSGPMQLTVTGVRHDVAPSAAQVVLNVYSFDEAQPQVSINGGAYQTVPWAGTDDPYSWRSLSIPVPLSDVRDGTNTITLKSTSGSTIVSNVSLILVAAALVP